MNKYVFSGHESFPCKTLWLKKGYDFVVQGKNFNNPDAVIDLGVGKNMVASIRYWLRVFGICEAYLLTDKQREFYHHVMTEYDNRMQWYQSICYTILDQRLDALRDEQEEKLADDLIYMFRTCEKYSSISQKADDLDNNDAYSFDLVSNRGINVRTQTYILPEKDKRRVKELEEQISVLHSGDNNMDVCALLSVLNKKITK